MKFILREEGTTQFLIPIPREGSIFPPSSVPIFFNPAMEVNRDATILFLSVVKPQTYLDAMGATGVRGLRAAHECGIAVTINDWIPEAIELIRRNTRLIGIECEITEQDVNMLCSSRKFDAVDVDPFGTPAPFIDSAIRSASRFLFITATDTAPLCGAHLKAGMRRYFSRPMNTDYHAEIALRNILGFVTRETIKYDRGIEPFFCFAQNHFIRLHLCLRSGARAADNSLNHIGYIHQCVMCPSRVEQKGMIPELVMCSSCGGKMRPIGPLWLGRINDRSLLMQMQNLISTLKLNSASHLNTLISLCLEELDVSFHYDYHRLAKSLKRSPPPLSKVINNLRQQGFNASRSHYSGTALKTDAPLKVILHTMNCD